MVPLASNSCPKIKPTSRLEKKSYLFYATSHKETGIIVVVIPGQSNPNILLICLKVSRTKTDTAHINVSRNKLSRLYLHPYL